MASLGRAYTRITQEGIPGEGTISVHMRCLTCRKAEMVAWEIGKTLPQVACGLQHNNLQGNAGLSCTSTGKSQIMSMAEYLPEEQ